MLANQTMPIWLSLLHLFSSLHFYCCVPGHPVLSGLLPCLLPSLPVPALPQLCPSQPILGITAKVIFPVGRHHPVTVGQIPPVSEAAGPRLIFHLHPSPLTFSHDTVSSLSFVHVSPYPQLHTLPQAILEHSFPPL